MLATRALSRAFAQMARNGKGLTVATVKNSQQLQLQPLRFSGHWTYRTGTTTVPMYKRVWGQSVSAFMWWWILWHLYWDWGHIVGEFPYPDTSLWTDAELGIPPDDQDE